MNRIPWTSATGWRAAGLDNYFARERLTALTIALIEASSMLVSMPAPKYVWPWADLIWM